MKRTRIVLAEAFSRFPGGIHRTDGPFSGESFREDILVPALKEGAVEVVLDGTLGYASSFLKEAFGGLRRNGFEVKDLETRLVIVSELDPTLANEAFSYIREEV